MTTSISSNKSLEKVMEAISNHTQTESENEEDHTNCTHHFGYLADLPTNTPIPEECLLCSKVVECIVKNYK